MHEIRMDHPAKNALGTDLVEWLEGKLDEAAGEPVLLTGTGDAFCAGLNLKEVAGHDPSGMEAMIRRVDGLAAALFDYPAPTVALVNGHAIAGGCVLTQCCDFRVAVDEPSARIGLNEVALGVCFPPVILAILRHRIPATNREDVLLGAQLYPPGEALARGLLDVVSADAGTVARKWLEKASTHPRETYAATKAILHGGVTDVSREEERRFVEDELSIWTSDEVRRRVLAVLEK